ncbi:MAG: hypothetical protein SGI91_20550 [Alphaproteobacteria bacterium]|jgi:hypothetical protein|nr:hypothetical protein [Alphaproteobacteria bacterium]
MCFYDPPLFLGMPDLSAATICALPLAASATRWRELLTSSLGLAVGFVAAHFFIVLLQQEDPPSRFYWMDEQATIVPSIVAGVAFAMVLVYALSRSIRDLWQADYLRATLHLLLALGLLGSLAYFVAGAHAFDGLATELLAFNTNAQQPPLAPVEIRIANCIFPPFGEGATGYSMLAVLVVFEMLVAVGIADSLNRVLVPGLAK